MARHPFALLSAAAAAALFASPAAAVIYNGLAVTPQMGWDNWNAFACNVSEELLLSTAQKIIDYGWTQVPIVRVHTPDDAEPSLRRRLRDLGYYYIVLDDCWSAGRSTNGTLQANTTKFPHGMAYVADQLHDMGLGFGMYSSAGVYTCAGYAASLGKEKQDAQTFADWGVDYLKYDNCFNEGQEGTSQITRNRYNVMSEALNATGRPILYSMCNWGVDYPWNWASTMANSWRITGDVYDSFDRPDARCPCTTWDCNLPGFHCSVMNIINKVAAMANKGSPGGWNDLDMLEVGNGAMSEDEYKLHMSMWAILKSPLIMGTDVLLMTPQTLSIYSNPAIIAISQDPMGSPAIRVWQKPAETQNDTYSTNLYTGNETSFWSGQLSGGDQVIAFVNAGPAETEMSATMDDVFIDLWTTGSSAPAPEFVQTWDVYDLWANQMSDGVAQAIIDGNSTMVLEMNSTLSAMRYNRTAMSYADGLAANDTALLGAKTTTLAPMGTVSAHVPSHGIAVYRLRSQGGGG